MYVDHTFNQSSLKNLDLPTNTLKKVDAEVKHQSNNVQNIHFWSVVVLPGLYENPKVILIHGLDGMLLHCYKNGSVWNRPFKLCKWNYGSQNYGNQ